MKPLRLLRSTLVAGRFRQAWLLAGWLAAHAAAGAAAPQPELTDQPLDQLLDVEVSGASKFTLRMSESAAAATVITADEIRALGHRTLADVLRTVRGVTVTSDRTYAYLGVRGVSAPGDYNTRALLLIDGNRVNDTVYEQALLGGEFPLDIDLIERVEFLPGQGSAVHGANALFGVINVVTRHPQSVAPAEAALSLDAGHARRLRLSGSRPLGDGGVLLSATRLRMDGSDVRYTGVDPAGAGGAIGSSGDGISRRTDHERRDQLFLRYAGPELSTTLVHSDRTKGLSAASGTVFGDPANAYTDRLTLADIGLQRPIDALSRWKLRLYAGRYHFIGDYVLDSAPRLLNRDRADSRWWGVEGDVFTERLDDHKLVIGADLQFSPRRDQSNADIDPATVYLDDHRRGKRYGLYVEDQWTVTPTFALTAGLRHDHSSGDGGRSSDTADSPRLAAVWRASGPVTLKVIHGRAFRPANAFESYYATPTGNGYKANPALRHEQVRGNEVVLQVQPSPATRWTASAYSNRSRDLLLQSVDPADGLLVYDNAGALHSHGIELEVERVWDGGLHLRANYSRQSVTGSPAPVAAQLAKAIAIVPLAGGWRLASQTLLVSRRGVVPGFGTTDLTLSTQLRGGWARLSFSVRDLFDRRPVEPGADSVRQPMTPQDGRTLGAQIELRYD